MGICIQSNQQNLETIYKKQPQFQVDRSKNNMKCLAVWNITSNSCKPLKWPYKFLSTCSYIVIVVSNHKNIHKPILQQERTSLQFAEMLFGAQFLILYLKQTKKLMLNNKQYQINVYSFYGDAVDDQLIVKAQLNHHMCNLNKYLQLGAGSLCLRMLNQSEPIIIKSQIKQFIDFESEQYQQTKSHIFFQQQLFCTSQATLQNAINFTKKSIFYQNFLVGHHKIPFVSIKQIQSKQSKGFKKGQSQQSLPFACQITQINIRQNKKKLMIQAGNIDSSNLLFQELNMDNQLQEIQKIQQFLKGLYLATQKVSRNFNILNQNLVKLVINCAASTAKNWFINDMNYKWIDMPDPLQESKQYNIQCLIYQVADLAGKYLLEPAGVVIHCSGYNPKIQLSGCRSGAIMAGLLMSSLHLSLQDSLKLINKKWKINLANFMNQQLKQLQKRRKQKPKGFHVYIICSYSRSFPKHLVAKYICEVQNINNIQGIDDYAKNVFVCVGSTIAKIMIGRQCQFKDDYEKYAKQHIKLLAKFEGFNGQITIEQIDKTFRKQPKIELKQQIIRIGIKSLSRNAGYKRNEEIVLKYPILRPVWEKKKEDGFYFTIKQKIQGVEIVMNKGTQWIGYEQDKQQFFQKLINCYLSHIPHEKIYVAYSDEDKSLFDASLQNI